VWDVMPVEKVELIEATVEEFLSGDDSPAEGMDMLTLSIALVELVLGMAGIKKGTS
jgi:hypothetical protein